MRRIILSCRQAFDEELVGAGAEVRKSAERRKTIPRACPEFAVGTPVLRSRQ